MPAPSTHFQPYASVHFATNGPGDARLTALQVVKDCNRLGDLRGKTVLITGCSSGIGVETARALYEAGAILFLTARDMPKLEKVIDESVSKADTRDVPMPVGIEIHLDSLASVRKGVDDFRAKSHGELHILIENAGVMACPYAKTIDGFERQIGTNHMARFLLFELVKPILLQTAKRSGTISRVVTVSSAGHRLGGINFDDINYTLDPSKYSKWGAYGQSKTANIYLASSIHRRYASEGSTAISVHPGAVMTPLLKHLEEEDFAALGGMNSFEKVLKTPEQGAATTVWAAVSPHFEDMANGGRYCVDVGECGPSLGNDSSRSAGYAPHIYKRRMRSDCGSSAVRLPTWYEHIRSWDTLWLLHCWWSRICPAGGPGFVLQ
jgi:NAD(P)-dependent dehydrogenase (short-subunit alcohol dehydrogenase family)